MKWPILRDVILFFGGLAGVIHETLFVNSDRPTLIILFAAMMGLPAFFQPKPPAVPAVTGYEDKTKTSLGGSNPNAQS